MAVLGFDVTPEIACLMNRLAASVSILVLPEKHRIEADRPDEEKKC